MSNKIYFQSFLYSVRDLGRTLSERGDKASKRSDNAAHSGGHIPQDINYLLDMIASMDFFQMVLIEYTNT